MSAPLTGTLKDRIREYVRRSKHVSFAELDNYVEGFAGVEGEPQSMIETRHNVVLWVASKAGAEAWIELSPELVVKPSPSLIYLIDGWVPQLPIAKRWREYKTPHWLPVTFSVKPMRRNRKATIRVEAAWGAR